MFHALNLDPFGVFWLIWKNPSGIHSLCVEGGSIDALAQRKQEGHTLCKWGDLGLCASSRSVLPVLTPEILCCAEVCGAPCGCHEGDWF